MLEFMFGKKKTPAEMLRENKRMLDKSIRELDRERMGLQNEEKKTIAEMKKLAKEGQNDAVKVLAKSLVRNRAAVQKMYALKSQLQAISLRLATLKSQQAMADSMRGATKAMRVMNRQLNLPNLQHIIREFEKQNEKMEMTGEMMGDAVDDALGGEGEEEETDDVISQVLDEIGITMNTEMANAPGKQMSSQQEQQAQPVAMGADGVGGRSGGDPGGGGLDDDLQARLDNLRKG